MTPIGWAMRPFQKYATFSGRAPRPEYWWFAILQGVLYLFERALEIILDGPALLVANVLLLVFSLACIIPGLAVGVRRLHDTDRSGWWLLILLVPIVGVLVILFFAVSKGTEGENRFGPEPVY